MTPDPFPGDVLQLDLLSVVARLRQLRDIPYVDDNHWLFRRLIECDLPRLEGHLHPATRAWADRLASEWGQP